MVTNGSRSYGGPCFHGGMPSRPIDHVCGVTWSLVSTGSLAAHATIYDLTGSGEDGLIY